MAAARHDLMSRSFAKQIANAARKTREAFHHQNDQGLLGGFRDVEQLTAVGRRRKQSGGSRRGTKYKRNGGRDGQVGSHDRDTRTAAAIIATRRAVSVVVVILALLEARRGDANRHDQPSKANREQQHQKPASHGSFTDSSSRRRAQGHARSCIAVAFASQPLSVCASTLIRKGWTSGCVRRIWTSSKRFWVGRTDCPRPSSSEASATGNFSAYASAASARRKAVPWLCHSDRERGRKDGMRRVVTVRIE